MTIYSRSAAVRPVFSPHFRFVFFFLIYRSRIAERGQLQHGFDEGARAPYCTDFVVLRHWRGLSRRTDGRRGAGGVHCYLWAVRGAAGMERAWEGARGGSSAEARRVPSGDVAQVQPVEEGRCTRVWGLS